MRELPLKSPGPDPKDQQRREGRGMACEGLMASQFGRRIPAAGQNALDQLRAEAKWRQRISNLFVVGRRCCAAGLLWRVELLRDQLRAEAFRWRRGSSALHRPLARSWRVLAFAAGLALLLAGASLFFLGRIESKRPTLYIDTGSAAVERKGKVVAARNGMRLKPLDSIITSAGSSMIVRYPHENTVLALSGRTRLSLLASSSNRQFRVTQGQIEVNTFNQRNPFFTVVLTPHAEIRLAKTHSLITARQSSTWLEVVEGGAEMFRSGESGKTTVNPGQFAVAARGLELAAQPEGQRWQSPYFASGPGKGSS